MSTTTTILTPELIALYAAFKAKLMARMPEDAKLAASEQLDESFECTLSQVTGAEITLKNTDAATDDLAIEAEAAAVTESAAAPEVASVDVSAITAATPDVVIEDTSANASEVQVVTANVSEVPIDLDATTADEEAGVITSDVPPNSGASTTAEQPSPRRSLRLRLANQEATLGAQEGTAIVSVTPSATGEGVHTRWHYPDDTVSVSATTSSGGEDGPSPDDGSTLVGSSSDEKEKEKKHLMKRASAPSPSPYPPCPPPYVLVPSLKPSFSPSTTLTHSKKRALDEDSADSDGPARRTRSKVAFATPPSPTQTPVGTRHRRRRAPTPGPRAARAPKVRSRSPSPSPPPPPGPSSTTTTSTTNTSSSHPTSTSTHPNTRPLAAEQSFYHASDFSIFHHPSFGPLDQQPIGKDTLPPWYKYSEMPEGIVNREVVKEGEEGEWTVEKVLAKERDDLSRERKLRKVRTSAAQVASTSRLPSPPPTPASGSGSSGKRAREDDEEEKEEGEERRRRTRARRE